MFLERGNSMQKSGLLYERYLEALVVSLLKEREQDGKDDFTRIDGVDFNGKPAYYIPYNIKEQITYYREQV
jgi:hypothetical protein